MEHFEYNIVDLNSLSRYETPLDLLNKLGAAGWELMSVSQLNIGIFKRRMWKEDAVRDVVAAPVRDHHGRQEQRVPPATDADREKLRQEMETIARAQGLSLGDILENNLIPHSPQGAFQFQDPQHPENTWSGRGRMPKWLAKAIASGQPKEAFRVPKD